MPVTHTINFSLQRIFDYDHMFVCTWVCTVIFSGCELSQHSETTSSLLQPSASSSEFGVGDGKTTTWRAAFDKTQSLGLSKASQAAMP